MESFWQELEGVYICNQCKYYSQKEEDKCPSCGCEMIGIQEKINFLEKDLTNRE